MMGRDGVGLGWDGMGWDGMGWDRIEPNHIGIGMGWDAIGWDWRGWDRMGLGLGGGARVKTGQD